MPFPLPPALETALDVQLRRPVFVVGLEIEGDPLHAWTGPGTFAPSGTGDAALDGKTFEGNEGALTSLTAPGMDEGGVSPVTLTAAGARLNVPAARQFLRDRRAYQGRPARVWLGYLTADSANIAGIIRFATGVMTSAGFSDDPENAAISVTIDKDLRLTRQPPRRLAQLKTLYPSDSYADYVQDVANKPFGPDKDVPRPGFPGYPNVDWTQYGGIRF